jgi:hypothetical protein
MATVFVFRVRLYTILDLILEFARMVTNRCGNIGQRNQRGSDLGASGWSCAGSSSRISVVSFSDVSEV